MKESGIGRRIQHVRGEMSQTAFAELLGISRSSLLRYEKDERLPDADFLALLCERLGADGHWLLTGKALVSPPDLGDPRPFSQVSASPASQLHQLWADTAERELPLAAHRAAAEASSHRSTWRVLAVLRSVFPDGSTLPEVCRQTVGAEFSEREVQAALLLLLRAGLVQELDAGGTVTYRAIEGLGTLRFSDDPETSAAVITVLEVLLNKIMPAMAREAGKVVATEVRIPSGAGLPLARDIVERVRSAIAEATAQPGEGDSLSLILGVAVGGEPVIDSGQPTEGSYKQS